MPSKSLPINRGESQFVTTQELYLFNIIFSLNKASLPQSNRTRTHLLLFEQVLPSWHVVQAPFP